jgi:uncharacterized membrane protein YdjX (TVP38/TMEM64 family)
MSEGAPRARPDVSVRVARAIRYASLVVIVASLVLAVQRLPTERLVERLQEYIDGLGVAGPLVLVAVYVVAALVFAPAWVLTVVSGALYGLGLGTLLASVAANAASALSFLISRYAARGRVERAARAHPRFAALDRAVTAGGWKIVLLMRLSPLVPFTVANYLFGLTGVRFVPFCLASVVGMLPHTALFVYLGHVGAEGLRFRATERTPAQWALLLVGLAATVVTSVWLTRLARKELGIHRRRARMRSRPKRRWWPSVAWLSAALASAGAAVGVMVFGDRLFGS